MKLLQIKRPIIIIGESGSSKTAIISNFLRNLDPAVNVSNLLNMQSASLKFCLKFADSPKHKLFLAHHFHGRATNN